MRDDEIKVSVIITVYNQENYIEKAVQSVLEQKVDFPIEVLIGDDSSTDGTVSIICQYAKRYPKLIFLTHNEVNIGASRNFYQLLQKARGQYVATLEGDDFWTDQYKLSKQIKLLECNPNLSGCVHVVKLVDRSGIPLPSPKLAWVRSRTLYELKSFDGEHLPGHISSLVFKNFYCETLNLEILTTHREISDRCIFLVLLTFGAIRNIPQYMSAYRILRDPSDKNVTQKLYLSQRKNFCDEMKLLSEMEKWLFQERGISKNFLSAKCGVFSAAMFGRNRREYRSLSAIKELLKQSGYPLRLLLYLPFSVWKKILLRCSRVQR